MAQEGFRNSGRGGGLNFRPHKTKEVSNQKSQNSCRDRLSLRYLVRVVVQICRGESIYLQFVVSWVKGMQQVLSMTISAFWFQTLGWCGIRAGPQHHARGIGSPQRRCSPAESVNTCVDELAASRARGWSCSREEARPQWDIEML
jgi:hypothetical protein